jgi:hypothetical protein
LTQGDKADISARRGGGVREETADVYQRLFTVSSALRFYLGLAFRPEPIVVRRPPAPMIPIEPAPIDDLLDAMLARIPETERKPRNDALRSIEEVVEDAVALGNHDRQLPKEVYFQILQDYECVRIPMASGLPQRRPPLTRNPAREFMDLRAEVVVALCDVGRLQWGACDFGPAQSGDMMHFDLGRR